MEYKCINGHDKCKEMLPCKECPYCELKVKKENKWVQFSSSETLISDMKN